MFYDVTVIGTGPGGYVAAIKAAQLGFKVAVVEKRKTFGGTCLNIGCIPSKALLHASEMFAEIGSLDTLGIEVGKPKLNLRKMLAHKDATVESNVNGVEFLLKKNKIDHFIGVGQVLGQGKLLVTSEDGKTREIETKNMVIATGSDVTGIPGVDVTFDEKVIVSSTGALDFKKVPKHLIVVGGGVIGLELGSVWGRLGAKITIVEYLDKILGSMDNEISRQFQKLLEKQGMVFRLGAKVTNVEKSEKGSKVVFEPVKGGAVEILEADAVLIATGRKPYTQGLGLEKAGIVLDKSGHIVINNHWMTSVPGIYAIGDVVKGPMLAHKAEDEAIAVAETIAGQAGHVNFDVIPTVVYTQPEIACVGKTEEDLNTAAIPYKIGKYPFSANGRARAMQHVDGFVKILANQETDQVLGAHILGYNAGEMIHELAVLMEFGGSSEDLARTCHAHPTMSEAVREAALATFFKPIHI